MNDSSKLVATETLIMGQISDNCPNKVTAQQNTEVNGAAFPHG